jgi:hypothetical protein
VKKPLLALVLFSLLAISSTTISEASATKGWVTSDHGPFAPLAAIDPGSTKICGDHKCGPFEDEKKSLEDKLKQNPPQVIIKVTVKSGSK